MRTSNHRISFGNALPATAFTIAIATSQLPACSAFAGSDACFSFSPSELNDTPMRPVLLALKRSQHEELEKQKLKEDQERAEKQKEEEAAKKKGEAAIPEGFGSEKPSLGIKLTETGPNVVAVSEIMPGSGAHGILQTGDQILFINGVKLTSLQQMPSIMASRNFNEKIIVNILRNGERSDVAIVLRQFSAPIGEAGSTAPSVSSGRPTATNSGVPTTTNSSSSSSPDSDSTGPTRISANPTASTQSNSEPTSRGTPITLPPAAPAATDSEADSGATPPTPSIRVGASTPPVEPLIPVGASTPSLDELEKSSSDKIASGAAPKVAQKTAASTTASTTAGAATGAATPAPSSVTPSSTQSSSNTQVSGTASHATTGGGSPASAISSSKEYIETEKKLTQALIDTYLKRADIYRRMERFDASLEDYNASIKIDAKSALAYSGRGRTLASMKKNKEAIAEFSSALQLDPNSAWDYTFRGMLYWEEKDFPKAIADFNKAIQLNPELHKAYVYRGNCYDSMGKSTEALADLTKAVQLDSKGELKGEPYKWRAILYEKMGSERRSVQDKAKSEELGLLPMFDY